MVTGRSSSIQGLTSIDRWGSTHSIESRSERVKARCDCPSSIATGWCSMHSRQPGWAISSREPTSPISLSRVTPLCLRSRRLPSSGSERAGDYGLPKSHDQRPGGGRDEDQIVGGRATGAHGPHQGWVARSAAHGPGALPDSDVCSVWTAHNLRSGRRGRRLVLVYRVRPLRVRRPSDQQGPVLLLLL